MNRTNKILLGALAVQLLIGILVWRGGESTTVRERVALLPGFEPSKVERIQFYATYDAGLGDKEQKVGVDLRRTEKGWVAANYQNYPVIGERVETLLSQLKSVQSRGAMAEGTVRQNQLDVADNRYLRKLVITAAGKDTVIYIGRPDLQRIPVRLGGQEEIHDVAGLTENNLGTTVRAWVEDQYFKVAETDVISFSIVHPENGTFDLERADGRWTVKHNGAPLAIPAGRALNQPALSGFLTSLADMKLEEPAAPRELTNPMTVSLRIKAPGPAQTDAGTQVAGETEYHIDLAKVGEEKIYVHVRGLAPVMIDETELEGLLEFNVETALIPLQGQGQEKSPRNPEEPSPPGEPGGEDD